MSNEIYLASQQYTKLGFVVHPLTSPNDKGKSPGKKPLLNKWADMKTPANDADLKKWFEKTDHNIGVVCGSVSGITVIDIDDPVFEKPLLDGIDTRGWLMSRRTADRGHIFFKFINDERLLNHEYSHIKIDIRNHNSNGGGGNIVLPPSVHEEGETYKWNCLIDDISTIPEMPDIFKDRLIVLTEMDLRLKTYVYKCREWVREFFNPKTLPDTLHGGDGRRCMLALCAELKANGFDTQADGEFISRLIYREDYDEEVTLTQWSHVHNVPWTSKRLCSEFPQYCNQNNTSGRIPEEPQSPTKDKNPKATYEPHVIHFANTLLNEGDSFRFIVDTWNKFHVGDKVIGEACACAVASTYMLNSSGLNIKPSGESGKGKSDGAKKFLHLLPDHMKIIGSLSGKAMFYDDSLKIGTVIYTDDVLLNEDIVSTIKQATTNFQEETLHRTVQKQVSKKYTIPPRISWWMTSVDGFDDDQMGNRFLGVDVDSSESQDKAVFEHQVQCERLGITTTTVDDRVSICRCMFDILREFEYKIIFPYSACVVWNNIDNRRNYPMFADILKSVTLYNIKQREKFMDCYLATEDDFNRAKEIYKGLAESNATNLTETELKVMRWISNQHDVTIQEVARCIKKSETTARYLMDGRDGDGGLLRKVAGLYSDKISENNMEGRSTHRKVYNFNGKYGLDSYMDVVSLDDTCMGEELEKFKMDYSSTNTESLEALSDALLQYMNKKESQNHTIT